MVLNRKKMEHSLWVGDESLLHVEEFKYIGFLFTNYDKLEREMDRRIRASFAVMRVLLWSVVTKRELSCMVKLSIYRSIFVPTLIYGH